MASGRSREPPVVQIADLAAADTDVARRAVDVLADVALKLGHEGLAEAHDFTVGLASGIKVGAALGAADRKTGHGILEALLEAQEFDNGKVDGGIKTKASLERAEGRVVLDAVSAVHMILEFVIHPYHTEFDGTLRLDHPLQDAGLLVLRMGVDQRLD